MNLSHRFLRLFASLFPLGLGVLTLSTLPAVSAEKAAALPTVTTLKRSAIQVGSSSFALVKGTKLEMLGRDGKMLLVKYRTSQGKIPYADTDYVLPEGEEPEEPVAEEPPAPPPPAKKVAPPLPAVAKHLPDVGQDKSRVGSNQQRETAGQTLEGQQPTKVTPPPALSLDQKPASNYGKMVQKTKQAEQAHNDKLVKPADEILDEKPKK